MYKLGSRIIDADKNAYAFVLSQEHFVIRFWGSDVLFLAFACAHATGARAFEEVVMSAAGMIFDWDMGLLSL
jgi:uncharacterized membrane protein